MLRLRKHIAVLATMAIATASLAACGDSDSGSGATELRLWHYEDPNSAMGVAWKAAIKEFERTHPGVTVKFEEKGFEQIQKTASMVLNSDEAPDVMEYNKGNATAGLLSKQGLLTDMTGEVSKRGWDKLIPANVQVTSKYDAKGVMGGDKWYGVPNYAEYLMVYYNKDMFAKHGVKVPTTMAELTAAADKFAAKGITPFANAGKEYIAHQYLYQLALTKADTEWVDALERYTSPVNFKDEAWMYGAKTFAEWVKKGYIAKKSVGLTVEDAAVSWIQGKSPMLFSGSWWFGRFQKEAKFPWDTGLWPGTKLTPGSGGNLWVVPEGAQNKELAYDFIDITMQKKFQNLLGNNGGIPVAADPSAITDAKSKKLIENFNSLAENDGLAFYCDWPVAGFYDEWVSQTQKLMNGDPPEEVMGKIQDVYDDGRPE